MMTLANKKWTAVAMAILTFSPMMGRAERFKFPDGTAANAIERLDEKMRKFHAKEPGKPLTEKQLQENAELKKEIIHGTFDIRELAMLALGDHWKSLTEEQRRHFVDILVSLLEERALFSKEQSLAKSSKGGKYDIIYYGGKPIGENRELVRTKVVVPSENIDIKINYKMKKEVDGWRIYDIVVDEASLVQNYKYQFDSIIKKSGYEELVRRMEKKLDEIRQKRLSEAK